MSSKVTMILTFIVSVVCPFIQELVDFIDSLKGRSSEVTKAIKQASSDFQYEIDGAIKPVDNKVPDKKSSSRFFGSWRDSK